MYATRVLHAQRCSCTVQRCTEIPVSSTSYSISRVRGGRGGTAVTRSAALGPGHRGMAAGGHVPRDRMMMADTVLREYKRSSRSGCPEICVYVPRSRCCMHPHLSHHLTKLTVIDSSERRDLSPENLRRWTPSHPLSANARRPLLIVSCKTPHDDHAAS